MKPTFKITPTSNGHTYLWFDQPDFPLTISSCEQRLCAYLRFVKNLIGSKGIYAIIPYSVSLEDAPDVLATTKRRYDLIADDFRGMAVNPGFTCSSPVNAAVSSADRLVIRLKDVMTIRSIPEEDLGEDSSQISFFCLIQERKDELMEWLQNGLDSDPGTVLIKDELFMHINCAKRQGYYDAIAVHSRNDIQDQLEQAFSQALDIT
ncbi:hypothetical protein ABDD95_07140 [Mucilaginibacter sp. PAMB04274]|uniref:hypothetical protein n=1 Tax=Mucilaginibacter sp. PAMB04274 TaxID=3138568 RepID=UPI0031F6B346